MEGYAHSVPGRRHTLDAIYQIVIHRFIYPLELLFTATLLALVPYFLLRGPVNRIARQFVGDGRDRTASENSAARRKQ
jgi:hypothetical protein